MVEDTKGKKTSEKELKTPEQETKTPTPEVETLTSQLSRLQAELEQTKKGLATAHQTLTEKDKELKRRTDLEAQIAGIQDTVELLATAITSKGEVENLDTSERQDILTEIKKKRELQEAKRKQEEATEAQQDYIRKADTIYARAKQVFNEDDEALERIEDLLINGRLDRAEKRVTAAEKGKQKPIEPENEEKRIEEKARKLLEERGLLTSETGLPSTASGAISKAEFQKLTPEERVALMPEVRKAIEKGIFK